MHQGEDGSWWRQSNKVIKRVRHMQGMINAQCKKRGMPPINKLWCGLRKHLDYFEAWMKLINKIRT